MELILHDDVTSHLGLAPHKIWEYSTLDSDSTITLVQVSGRYPQTGTFQNIICKEIVFVLEGAGKISSIEKEYEVSKFDAVIIESDDEYSLEGEMLVLLITIPTSKDVSVMDL